MVRPMRYLQNWLTERRTAATRRAERTARLAVSRSLLPQALRRLRLTRHPRHVLVITVDALRRDRVSLYGCPRDTTPTLRRVAEQSAVFTRASAPAGWTYPAVTSLLSGLYPHKHGATYVDEPRNFDAGLLPGRVRDDLLLVPEILETLGFQTYFASAIAFAEFVAQGRFGTLWSRDLAEADELVNRYLKWMRPRRDKRTFAYLHLSDPHEPLRVAPPHRDVFGTVDMLPEIANWGPYRTDGPYDADFEAFRAMRLRYYDASIRFVDDQLARLLAALEDLKLRQDTLLVVTADHGEEFWEHTELERAHFHDPRPWYGVSHGHHLFNEALDIPLVLQGPGVQPGTFQQRVSSVDIVPTILDLMGVELAASLDGCSLLDPPAGRPILAEATAYGYEKKVILQDDLKLYTSPGDGVQWVFDLQADPGERSPGEDPEASAALASHLPGETRHAAAAERMDAEVADRLRALGYLS